MASRTLPNPSTQHLNSSNGLRTCAIFLFIHEELCPWHCIILKGHCLNLWRPKHGGSQNSNRWNALVCFWLDLRSQTRCVIKSLWKSSACKPMGKKKERYLLQESNCFLLEFQLKVLKEMLRAGPERSGYCAGPEWHTLGECALLPALLFSKYSSLMWLLPGKRFKRWNECTITKNSFAEIAQQQHHRNRHHVRYRHRWHHRQRPRHQQSLYLEYQQDLLARCLPHSIFNLSRNGSGENMWSSQLMRYVQRKQQHFSSKFYYIEAVSEMKQTASNRWPHVEASYMYIYVQQSSPKSTRTQLQQRLYSVR